MSEFDSQLTREQLEEGTVLSPNFGASGLVTAVCTHFETGELLMVAHMNEEALRRTIESGEAWYWSRSRKALWHKGATSGTIQNVAELRIDCDQDAVWLKVIPQRTEGTCHTGRPTCFYRKIESTTDGKLTLRHV